MCSGNKAFPVFARKHFLTSDVIIQEVGRNMCLLPNRKFPSYTGLKSLNFLYHPTFSHDRNSVWHCVALRLRGVQEQHYPSVTWPWPRPGSPLGWWILEDLAQEVMVTQVFLRVMPWWYDGTRHALTLKMSWSPFDSHPAVAEPIFPTPSSLNRPETVWSARCHNPDWIRLKRPATLPLPVWGHVASTAVFGVSFHIRVFVCFPQSFFFFFFLPSSHS